MNAKIDLQGVTLKTERLLLREFEKEDLEDLFEYASVPGVGEMAGFYHHETKKESKKVLQKFMKEKNALALVKDGHVIGSISADKYNETWYTDVSGFLGTEISFVLSKKYWGQGLMREAAEAFIRYLFDQCRLDFITCGHFESNHQSERLIARLNFEFYDDFTYYSKMDTLEPSRMYILWK